MKTRALLFIVVATVAVLIYLRVFNSMPRDVLQAPSQAAVTRYYSNTERALDALGEGTKTLKAAP